MLSQDTVSKYIVGIVLIVAVVGILTVLTQSLGSDISGQAIKMKPAKVTSLDSDKDGVLNTKDKCPGYDDKVDTDSDGTPDGCDDDDDGDGYSDGEEIDAGTDPLDASDYPVEEVSAAPMIYVNGGTYRKISAFSIDNEGRASTYPEWESSTDNPVQYGVAVADGVVYGGGTDLYAFDADDGTQLWRFSTPTGIISEPEVADGIIYFGSQDDKIYAVNNDGTAKWSYATGGDAIYRPTVANGVVYVGSDDDYLYALDADTGSVLWSYNTNGNVRSTPAVADGVVYVGAADAYIYALDADNGNEMWNYRTADDGSYIRTTSALYSPTVADGVVYIGGLTYASGSYTYYLYAFDADDGSKLWTYNVDSMVRAAPLVQDGVVYFVTDGGYVYALEADTGTNLWTRTPTSTSYSGVSTPALYDGVLYVGTSEMHLRALDADDGSLLWYGLTNSYVRGAVDVYPIE